MGRKKTRKQSDEKGKKKEGNGEEKEKQPLSS